MAGAGPVFELARVWRNGESGPLHAPEFTMLEWYRPGLPFEGLMDETEALVRAVCPPVVAHAGVETDLRLPFERVTVAEAFAEHCGGLDILGTEGDAARLRAEAWDASLLSMPEHQCKPHPSTYGFRGVGVLRIWDDRDEDTQQLVRIHTHIAWQEQHREIWMDGRPHPPEYAAHTWQGFSTGSWEGDVLVVKTTHLKAGWMRRNGLPLSDRATMTDRFHRYGDVMTHVSIVEDPVYLTEPLVKTNGFLLQPNGTMTPYPCEPVVEIVRDPGFVPHYLPGTNPFLKEFGELYHLQPAATRGGAATALPEFAETLR